MTNDQRPTTNDQRPTTNDNDKFLTNVTFPHPKNRTKTDILVTLFPTHTYAGIFTHFRRISVSPPDKPDTSGHLRTLPDTFQMRRTPPAQPASQPPARPAIATRVPPHPNTSEQNRTPLFPHLSLIN